MTKKELLRKVAEDTGLTMKDVEKVYSSIFNNLKEELKNGGSFMVADFGTFKCTERAARTGRNPQTGEPITIPEKKVIKFKQSSKFFEE